MSDPVLFDLARDGSLWGTVLATGGFACTALVWIWVFKKTPLGRDRMWIGYLLSALWALPLLVAAAALPSQMRTMDAVRDGRAPSVIGEISNLERWSTHRNHEQTRFDVGDVHVTTVPSTIRSALANGQRVRLHYVGDATDAELVRLELLR